MASKPPPIIRSTKAFSVEIPEGSNSAKSRRSDVVPGEEVEIHRKSSNFHELEIDSPSHLAFAPTDIPDRLASMHEADATGNQTHQESNSQSENIQAIDDGKQKDRFAQLENSGGIKDRLAQIKQDALNDNLQSVDSGGQIKDRLAQVKQDALKDNLQPIQQDALSNNNSGLQASDSLQDKDAGIAKEAIKDRLVGIPETAQDKQQGPVLTSTSQAPQNPGVPTEGLDTNLQAIPDESGSDNLQTLPDTGLTDNTQALEDDKLADNLQPIHVEARQDKPQNVANNGLKDNTQALDKEAVKDRTLAVNSEALEDNNQALTDEGLDDNQQALPDDELDDNRQALNDESLKDKAAELAVAPYQADADAGIAKDALSDEDASLPVEGVDTRSDSTEKSQVQDHVVALPDTHQPLWPGPSPVLGGTYGSAQQAAAAKAGHTSPGHAVTTAHSGPAAQANTNKAEQAKRAEAFHSRVQAIRQSVSGINHLLDDLQDKP